MPDGENDDFNERFVEWIREHIGVPRSVFLARDTTDDWTYVVMMHAVLESALTHLIVTKIGNPKLDPIIARLDTGNERTGKIAFIRAYELLPEDTCLFIRYFGELRNTVGHNIRHFDFNIKDHLSACQPQQRKNWERALLSWCNPPLPEHERKAAFEHPRDAINNACMEIITRCLKQQKIAEGVRKIEQEALEAIRDYEESKTKE